MGASRVFGAKHHCALCFRFAGRIRRGVVSPRCESGSLWSVYYVYGKSEQRVYGESEQGEAEKYARLPDSVLCDHGLSVTTAPWSGCINCPRGDGQRSSITRDSPQNQ